jgi:hypothetical protein
MRLFVWIILVITLIWGLFPFWAAFIPGLLTVPLLLLWAGSAWIPFVIFVAAFLIDRFVL